MHTCCIQLARITVLQKVGENSRSALPFESGEGPKFGIPYSVAERESFQHRACAASQV